VEYNSEYTGRSLTVRSPKFSLRENFAYSHTLFEITDMEEEQRSFKVEVIMLLKVTKII